MSDAPKKCIHNQQPFQEILSSERGGNGIVLPIISLSARRGWVVNTTTWLPYLQEKGTSTPCTAAWDLGPVWSSTENLAPTGVQTPVK
jgi:hypothetical protein